MRYEQVIIANRYATSADGFGGVNKGATTHLYSGYADVQETSEQYISQGVILANEGDAVVFLNEADTTVLASGLQHGDEVTILWEKGDVLVDANGAPLEDADGEWLYAGDAETTTAAVSSLRKLDNHLAVKYE